MHIIETNQVLFFEKNGVGVIMLNRPKALNALTHNMINNISVKLSDWAEDDSIQAVIIEGIGGRAFCSGFDIKDIAKLGQDNVESLKILREEYRLNYKIANYPKPYIAFLGGITMGGGIGVSIHGKYRIATEHTVFAMPEVAIGLFPDVGMGYVLSRYPDNIGLYLALTAKRIGLSDCMSLGIATHYVHSKNLTKLKSDIMKNPSDIDKVIRKHSEEVQEAGDLTLHSDSIRKCFSYGSVDEIMQALKDEKTEWGNLTLETIKKMSPFSLELAFKQQQFAKKMSFKESISMEYGMVKVCLKRGDFFEGVRAMLIDKDNAPKWFPATLEKVVDSEVQECFEVSDKHDILLDI